ncbi:chaperonin GroEL [Anaerocolumna sp. MB42-C2]|uniref:chaperonin GroEL n=1 Tax=Anaerocolumna sp. MB42-C2 TaxID=3070997 RepID=UPI0027E1D133|nr:chaperonin GroEL [Anaerocolumna sp. MB42-C2]WMJ88817.1 chaperonin GroEL [Anaerocolumna sp. MB42-C2]
MIKNFKYSEDARAALAEGIQEVYKLLSSTFGPTGCNAVLDDENGNLLLSSQTYSILRNLKAKDLFVDEGIQLAKEAAFNTERLAGDGSVMTLLFINEMINQGKRLMAAGANPVILGRGLKKALPAVLKKIKELAQPFTKEKLLELLQYELADEKLTKLVYDAYEKVGKDGTVIVKEGHGLKTELEFMEGFEIPGGYLTESICPNLKSNVKIMQQPYILITDGIINQFAQLLPVLEQIVETNAGLIIIAEEIQGEALTLLISNIQKKVFNAVAIKAPGIGRRKADLLNDLAVVTGGCVCSENAVTLENVKLSELGRAGEVRIEKNKTLFLNSRGTKEAVKKRVEIIKEYIQSNETEFLDKNQYYERIGNLEGKIAFIRVGGHTLLQMHEETHKIQSALAFVRAVAKGGVLSGGGSALAAIANILVDSFYDKNDLKDEILGKLLILDALRAPAGIIVRKDGLGEKESLKIMEDSAGKIGYNLVKHEFTDMKAAGIFDAAAVVTTALHQAVSVVYEWLYADVLMVSVQPDQEDIELMKQGVPIMR